MFGILKKIFIVWILFIAFAVISGGGDPLRSFYEKTGLQVMEYAATKADSLKEEADGIVEFFKGLTGKKKDIARNMEQLP